MKCLHWLWRWCYNWQNHSCRRRCMSANQKHIQKCAQLDHHRQFWGKPQCSRRRCNNEIVTVLICGIHNFKDGCWWATFVHKPEYFSCRHIQWYIETNPYAKFRQISYSGYEGDSIARKNPRRHTAATFLKTGNIFEGAQLDHQQNIPDKKKKKKKKKKKEKKIWPVVSEEMR